MKKAPLLALSMTLLLCACASPPPPARVLPPEEQERVEATIGSELAQRLESYFVFKSESDVQDYLRTLVLKLSEAPPVLGMRNVGVFLTRHGSGLLQNFSLPGNRIYLSIPLLKKLRFESEVAAVLAFEVALLKEKAIVLRLGELQSKSTTKAEAVTTVPSRLELFGREGLLNYGNEKLLAACRLAFELLYRSGYDPRGLASLWRYYQDGGAQSPYSVEQLRLLEDETRQQIATRAPLLNPVVRSAGFIAILKKVDKL